MRLFLRKIVTFLYIYSYRIVFKLRSIKYGKNLNVIGYFSLQKSKKSFLKIGDNFIFSSGRFINPISRNIRGGICINHNASLQIGDNVGISASSIWVHSNISIGDNVKIGADSIIIDSDCHSLDYLNRREHSKDVSNKKDLPIVIGNDVLIGARCIILKGVKIGERTIIGAGSVVVKSIPSDCIAAGNPCRVLKKINTIIESTE